MPKEESAEVQQHGLGYMCRQMHEWMQACRLHVRSINGWQRMLGLAQMGLCMTGQSGTG